MCKHTEVACRLSDYINIKVRVKKSFLGRKKIIARSSASPSRLGPLAIHFSRHERGRMCTVSADPRVPTASLRLYTTPACDVG